MKTDEIRKMSDEDLVKKEKEPISTPIKLAAKSLILKNL